jgi:crotonobetainyl-CoA:carnitine CoA-transferase CaiB-like acyl-CoA transferase
MSKKPGPLTGVRILDAATFLAAPTAASMLSDYGAEVIKVEAPGGDEMRNVGPHRGTTSLWWKVVSRNRQSITLDLNKTEGRQILKSLAAQCDIIIMNYRPSTLKRWGLEFQDLAAVNSDIVYYHLTAFGEGPYAGRPGFARVAEAYAGLTNRTGLPDGPPIQSGYAMLGDGISGMFGAFAVMLALRQRDLTGDPQYIDLGLYEPILSMMEDMIVNYDETGSLMSRLGNSSPRWSPHGLFRTKDDLYAVIACSKENLWQRLRGLIGDEWMKEYDNDPRARLSDRPRIEGRVQEWVEQHTLSELSEICNAAGLAIGPVNTPREVINDPHIIARGSIITLDDPETGKPIRMASPAGRYSGFDAKVRSVGPLVGEHTDQILKSLLGFDAERINELRESHVID